MIISEPSESSFVFIQECLKKDPAEFIEKMKMLGDFLYETNQNLNLTAIKEDGFWSRHVADSLSVCRYFPEIFTSEMQLCDLGCGAGFPSLVLAAAFPEVRITSIDSTRKKIDYVNAAAAKLSLNNLKGIHGRGNELGRKEPFRAAFNVIFARAVASADILVKEAGGMLKANGSLIIYRTPEQYEQEIPFLKKWKKGPYRATECFELPDSAGTRLFLQIKQMREIH